MHILVAEDDAISRELLRRILESGGGHTLTLAADGGEAWGLLQDPARRFDACVFDIQMPSVDGLELAAKIRADERLARTPIVLCSAANDRPTVERAAGLAVSGYIVKPYAKAGVLEKMGQIEAALAAPRPAAPPSCLEDPELVCRRLGIDAATHLALLEAMVHDLKAWAAELRSSPSAGEAGRRRVRADGLKGACLSLGAAEAARHVAALRPLLESPEAARLEPVLGGLEREIARLDAQIELRRAA